MRSSLGPSGVPARVRRLGARRVGGRAVTMALGGLAAALCCGAALAGPAFASGARAPGHSSGSAGTVGTVVSVDRAAGEFTIRTAAGSTVEVKVTKATSYREGAGTATFSDVTVGESVAVIGTTSHGVETAAVVVVGRQSGRPSFPGGPGAFARGDFGTVTSVDRSAGTFELKTRTGKTVEVRVTRSTRYRSTTSAAGSFSDVKVGETVAVVGTTTRGVETASSVFVGIGPPRS